MLRLVACVSIVLALVACKKSEEGTGGGGGGGGGATCEAAVDNFLAKDPSLGAPLGRNGADKPEWAAKARPVVIEACTGDQWPGEIVSCLAGAADKDAAVACWKKADAMLRARLSERLQPVEREFAP